MRYLDVCAGISASTVAWKPLGWQAAAYSEIEAAPRSILSHHYPDTPLHGDFTTIAGDEYGPIDLLVGGTPCQDFSVAGLRAGLAGERGNLSLQFLRLADRARPRWLVWENVPGVLSLDGGRAFGAILGGLGQLGYGFAYRVLDAQFFGVPQRRRRVFVVGYLGDWRRAAAVLFERHSLSGHSAPRREARAIVAALTSAGVGTCGADDNQGQAGHLISANVTATLPAGGNSTGGDRYPGTSAETAPTMLVAKCLTSPRTGAGGSYRADPETETLIAHALRGEGFDASEDGTGRGTPLVPVAFDARQSDVCVYGDRTGPMDTKMPGPAVAFSVSQNANGFAWESDVNPTLQCRQPSPTSNQFDGVRLATAVRRLTPRECERLQGFPDDYTLVPYRKGMMADGPRYRALGNSMAVPVMRWIGERIAAVEAITTPGGAAVRAAA